MDLLFLMRLFTAAIFDNLHLNNITYLFFIKNLNAFMSRKVFIVKKSSHKKWVNIYYDETLRILQTICTNNTVIWQLA